MSKTLNTQFKVQLLVKPRSAFQLQSSGSFLQLAILTCCRRTGTSRLFWGEIAWFWSSFCAPAGWSRELIGIKRQCGSESAVHQMLRMFPVQFMWVGNCLPLTYQEVAGTKGEGTIREKNNWVSTLHKSGCQLNFQLMERASIGARVWSRLLLQLNSSHYLIPCLDLPGLLQVQRDNCDVIGVSIIANVSFKWEMTDQPVLSSQPCSGYVVFRGHGQYFCNFWLSEG